MNEKIKSWCEKNNVKVKDLAVTAGVSEKTVYNFFNGSEIKSGSIKEWAKKWPQMICYALDLQCEEKLEFDEEDHKFWAKKLEMIDRIERLEKRVFESEESQKTKMNNAE